MSIGPWEPFWLESGGRSLYAALHPAQAPQRPVGVVCVPPLLHEQPRSRRFITEVASGLAALGLPCLRFDFEGSGDSSGPGERLDLDSMCADLDLAVSALRSQTGVERVVLIAWRAAALPVWTWLAGGRRVDRIVLWEPVTDGAQWLSELERQDARERARRPRPRPGVPRTADPNDGQLMGFGASAEFRRGMAGVRAEPADTASVPAWVLAHAPAPAANRFERVIPLPSGTPSLAGAAGMESAFFMSPALERTVVELGRALLEEAVA